MGRSPPLGAAALPARRGPPSPRPRRAPLGPARGRALAARRPQATRSSAEPSAAQARPAPEPRPQPRPGGPAPRPAANQGAASAGPANHGPAGRRRADLSAPPRPCAPGSRLPAGSGLAACRSGAGMLGRPGLAGRRGATPGGAGAGQRGASALPRLRRRRVRGEPPGGVRERAGVGLCVRGPRARDPAPSAPPTLEPEAASGVPGLPGSFAAGGPM